MHSSLQIVPPQKKKKKKKRRKKKITGLSASITFKIMNQSKYALGFWNYNSLSALCWKPHLIWFGSHEEIGIFVRYVISPFHPSFDSQQTHTTQRTRNSTLLLNGLCRLYTKLGWKALMANKKKNPISLWLLNQIRWGFRQNADN